MWLKIPTSHCSAATEDSISPSDALCQKLAASVSWRGRLLRPQSWRLAWKTEGWRRRLSGLTLQPSQANSSVAAWLDSLVGFPAKTSALQGDRPESTESEADCSLRSSDSFASWSPSSGCFLRTSRQFSIFQREQPYLENLPKSGLMRNGELFERPMLVDRTSESGRLCWPTPATRDYRSPNGASHMDRSTGAKHLDQLPNFIQHSFLPAPPTSTHGDKSPSTSTRRLNPDFVDWLMGLIPGWTNGKKIERRIYETWAAKIRNRLAAICSTDYQQDGGEKTGAAHHTVNAVSFMRRNRAPSETSSKHFERSVRCGNCVPALPQEDGRPRRNQTRSDSAEEMRCLPPNVSSEEVKSDVVRDGVYPRDGAHDGAQEVEMNRVDRLRAGGNGVVPLQGAVALALLLGRVR